MPPSSSPPRATGLTNQPTGSTGEAKRAEGTPQPMELEQEISCSDSAGEQQGPRPFGGHRPGEGPVPPGVDTVVLLSGEQVYRGTPEQPILVYEECKAENNGQNRRLAIWRSERVENERERMRAKVQLNLIETPQLTELPHLPDWAAPNGWDFWGRPWAYMDAPSGNSKVGVTSEAGKARVTVAVLVRLDREVQYLPDQNVAKSASAAAMRVRKTRVFRNDGSLREDDARRVMPYTAARTLFPRGWGGDRSESVYSLLKCWHSYRVSRVGQRPNPPMPEGDVTPEGCDRPAPPPRPKVPAGAQRPPGPVTTTGPSPERQRTRTAAVRAAALQARAQAAPPVAPQPPRTQAHCAAALRAALNSVQQRQQAGASATGEAMEQESSQPVATPSKPEEWEAEMEGEIERPLRGQGAYGRLKDTSRRHSIDGSAKTKTRDPTEGEQRVTTALKAAGGHPPPGPDVPTIQHRDPAVFNPETNYNRVAFPPPRWHIPQGRANHMTEVSERMPEAWCSQTHADLPVYLDRLKGVAHTSRQVADCGMLQSYARCRQDLILALGRMDDEIIRLRRRDALLDESQAGPLLATFHQLRADKEDLILRNQTLQAGAATQVNEELGRTQAATMAAEERASEAEHQRDEAQERIAQLKARGDELEEQIERLQSQPQAQADQALQKKLAAAEGQVQQLQGQVLVLNQQLLAMTQQSHQYLQEIMRMKTQAGPASASPPVARGFPMQMGNVSASTSPVFAGSGVTMGMFVPQPAIPPAGTPGYVGAPVPPAPQPTPTVTTASSGGGVVTTSVITPSRGTMGDGSMGHGPAQQ